MKNPTKQINFFCFTLMLVQSVNAQHWTSGVDIPEATKAANFATYKNANGDGFLYVMSGRNSTEAITPRNQCYDLTNNTWTDKAPLPTGVLSAATARLKDSIYVIGGFVSSPASPTRKVYKYSINEDTWSQVANYPSNISDTEAVAYQDSLIYVAGGYNTGRLRVYNSKRNTWRNATSVVPTGNIRWGGFTVANDKLIYLCGGDNTLSPVYSNTVRIGTIDQNDRANITWTLETPYPGQTRSFFEACPWKNGIIVVGGSTDYTQQSPSDECYFYDLDTGIWTQLPSKPTAWLFGNAGSMLLDDEWKLICASGYNGAGYLYQTEIFSESAILSVGENTGQLTVAISLPVKDSLRINTAENIKQLRVYDLLGKEMSICSTDRNTYDVAHLQKGTYLIKIILVDQKIFTTKFLKI